ncbi:DNA cytosine methyltransferase [Melghirimyces algeriensis]|nr:DNA cytosine methyltransferase [Melghirimyces algeriensis]
MNYNVTPTQPSNGFAAAELFCGGGLMAVGLKESGFNIVWANDFDKRAIQAYRYNLGGNVIHADIKMIDPNEIPDVDIIAGGPPCQDYSVGGKGAGEKGKNGRLVYVYLNIIEKKQPKAFIFENVKGLIGKRHRHTFDALIDKFNEIGYTVSWELINAWDYGVAQKRERVFIVGIRKDLGFSFVFPKPKPEDYRTQVLRDVIGDLPEPGVPLNEKQISFLERNPTSVRKNRPVTMEEPSRTLPAVLHKGVPYGLYYPNHNKKHYWTPPKPYIRYKYDQSNRIQKWSQTAATITAHHNSGKPIHPSQSPRRFTVRECLRIQSVPDWYVLPDDLSLSAQYRIVGNGVASRVAWYLGRSLGEQLTNRGTIV